MRAGKHKASRGVSLVEAMVALAVMAFGMLAVVGVQSTLRLNADVAKQRSEATRIAQENLEHSRVFAVIDTADIGPGQTAWDQIVTATFTVTPETSNTTYTVQRAVATYADPPAKALNVTVTWNDRSGQPQALKLSTAIAAAAPALSGTLHVRPGTAAAGPVRRPFKRHPTIPAQARDFGSRSAFVPPSNQRTVIVFDNVTGLITGLCTLAYDRSNLDLESNDIQSCSSNTTAQLLSGFVRFERSTSGSDLRAVDVENPIGPALRSRVQVQLSSSGHPHVPICFDDATEFSVAGGALPFATYYCVVFSNSELAWSGISSIVPEDVSSDASHPWVIAEENGTDTNRYRVCRYTPAANDAASIANQDHPRNYASVSGNLTNQNFVVISAIKHCPTDVAANPAAGDLINSNTLQHQPAPSP
jgi:Tfp pilus assembly protein PilV